MLVIFSPRFPFHVHLKLGLNGYNLFPLSKMCQHRETVFAFLIQLTKICCLAKRCNLCNNVTKRHPKKTKNEPYLVFLVLFCIFQVQLIFKYVLCYLRRLISDNEAYLVSAKVWFGVNSYYLLLIDPYWSV